MSTCKDCKHAEQTEDEKTEGEICLCWKKPVYRTDKAFPNKVGAEQHICDDFEVP